MKNDRPVIYNTGEEQVDKGRKWPSWKGPESVCEKQCHTRGSKERVGTQMYEMGKRGRNNRIGATWKKGSGANFFRNQSNTLWEVTEW